MKLTKTLSGNLASLMMLDKKFNTTAVVYTTPEGKILAVKPGDTLLFESFDSPIEVPQTTEMRDAAEENLLKFYSDKICTGNPGSAIALYDILNPETRDEIMKDLYLGDEGYNEDEEDGWTPWDMSEFFAYLYERGRGDVAEAISPVNP